YAWYRWGDSQQPAGGEQVADGQAQTDAQGNFSVKLPANLGKDNHSRTLTLDVEVTDVDGQVIASQGTANVHVGAFYIGLRPDGGEYRIGAEGRDDAGHTIKSSAYSWVYGGDVFWGVNDTNRVDLIADKSSYKPGDTASILVTAPYAGMSALMTIERGEVIEHK